MKVIKAIFLVSLLILSSIFSFSTNDSINKKATIVQFALKQEINPQTLRITQRAFELAKESNADAIVIFMNTYGGALVDADSIRTKILNSEIPVYVLIKPNAASAGALISIACNKIYMAKGSTIGAATVVNQTAEEMPDKYQSYMRAMMRSTAQERGRDPNIAEAMVDQDIEVDSVSTKGMVLTFTRDEAKEHGFCDGFAETIAELLEAEGYTNYEIKEFELTAMDKIIHFLINPFFHGLLILLIIGGIYFELQTPGVGFPLAIAILAAILYFAPLYIEHLAEYWEILIFIAGLILIGLEIFVIPGFGIAGVTGIIFMLIGLILSMVGNIYFDFTFTGTDELIKAFIVVTSSFIIAIIGIFATGGRIIKSKLFQRLVLTTTLAKEEQKVTTDNGPITESSNLIGKTGESFTEMFPSGKVIIENEIYDALSEGEYIPKNTAIVVLKDLGNKIVVRAK